MREGVAMKAGGGRFGPGGRSVLTPGLEPSGRGKDRKRSFASLKPTGQVAVSPARLAALLDPPLGRPRGQGLAGRRQGVDLPSELCLEDESKGDGEQRL